MKKKSTSKNSETRKQSSETVLKEKYPHLFKNDFLKGMTPDEALYGLIKPEDYHLLDDLLARRAKSLERSLNRINTAKSSSNTKIEIFPAFN